MTSRPASRPNEADDWIQPVVAPRLSLSAHARRRRSPRRHIRRRARCPGRMRRRISRIGRDDPGLCVGRKQADQEGRAAHQADGGEEGALAAEPVADHSEDDRAQRPEGEAGGEQAERGDQRRRSGRARRRTPSAMIVASEPKMKKSYHSNAVPADEAVTTRAIDQGLCVFRCRRCHSLPLSRRDSSRRFGQSSLRIVSLRRATTMPNRRTFISLVTVFAARLLREPELDATSGSSSCSGCGPVPSMQIDQDRSRGIGERAGEAGRADAPQPPMARARLLSAFVDTLGRAAASPSCLDPSLAVEPSAGRGRSKMILSVPSPVCPAAEEVDGIEGRLSGQRRPATRNANRNSRLTIRRCLHSARRRSGRPASTCRRSPIGLAFRDLAQDPAHDLARAGLGQRRRELDSLGRGERADLAGGPAG